MAKFIRYVLARFCFAASFACLALWIWGDSRWSELISINGMSLAVNRGECITLETPQGPGLAAAGPRNSRIEITAVEILRHVKGSFGLHGGAIYFPLWYPALVFALAGIGVLRFRRQFSIRSALIYVSVVAVLLGMAVIL